MRAQRTLIQGDGASRYSNRISLISIYDSDDEKVNLTGKAMVGLVINNEDIEYDMEDETTLSYYKLKIYACDDLESIISDAYQGDYHLSCWTERVQKCSRLIFVWTWSGRGIEFLDGHGIPFNVSFFNSISCNLL